MLLPALESGRFKAIDYCKVYCFPETFIKIIYEDFEFENQMDINR
jgi:hypothetical protein